MAMREQHKRSSDKCKFLYRNHLTVGPLDGSLGAQQGILKVRLAATFKAIQDAIDVSLQRHVNTELALFERLLLINDKNRR